MTTVGLQNQEARASGCVNFLDVLVPLALAPLILPHASGSPGAGHCRNAACARRANCTLASSAACYISSEATVTSFRPMRTASAACSSAGFSREARTTGLCQKIAQGCACGGVKPRVQTAFSFLSMLSFAPFLARTLVGGCRQRPDSSRLVTSLGLESCLARR